MERAANNGDRDAVRRPRSPGTSAGCSVGARRAVTVLAFAFVLAIALAAPPAATPVPVVLATDIAGDVGLAEASTAASTLGGAALVALDTVTDGGWRPGARGASRLRATAPPLSLAACEPLGPHSGRAPPLA
jgi:hypothetical protein